MDLCSIGVRCFAGLGRVLDPVLCCKINGGEWFSKSCHSIVLKMSLNILRKLSSVNVAVELDPILSDSRDLFANDLSRRNIRIFINRRLSTPLIKVTVVSAVWNT